MSEGKKHMCIRLDYPTDTNNWESDVAYIEDKIEGASIAAVEKLTEVLNCGMLWEGYGLHDGEIVDMDEAICAWYDTLFRPTVREFAKGIGGLSNNDGLNWKALEAYLFTFYVEDDADCCCGSMEGAKERIKEIRG